MTEYIPRPGDIVKFPGAPVKANQDRVYEITDTVIRHIDPPLSAERITAGAISFRLYCGDPVHIYKKNLQELQAIGMKLVRSVDKLDPTWKGE